MLDVLSTRIQEVYAKWDSRTDVIRDTEDNVQRLSLDGLLKIIYILIYFFLNYKL